MLAPERTATADPVLQSQDEPKLITTTYRDYDLSETSKLVRLSHPSLSLLAHRPLYAATLGIHGPRDDGRHAHLLPLHPAPLHPGAHGRQEPLRRQAHRALHPRQARHWRPQAPLQGRLHVRT